MSKYWNRRQLLSIVGAAGLNGLAGCGGRPNSSDSAGSTPTEFSDSPSPTDTETVFPTATPETEPPVIEAYDAIATESRGVLTVSLEASDNFGLRRGVVRTSVQEFEKILDGQQGSLETRINGSPGTVEQIHLLLEDEAGNRTEEMAESYVRKYDVKEDTRLNVGAVYLPDFPLVRTDCWDGREPAVGTFDGQYPEWVFERHADQFAGFGIDRVLINYNGDDRIERQIKRFLGNTELLDTLSVEPKYNVTHWYWGEDATEPNEDLREDVLKPHMTWIRDNILSRDNVSTFEDRPVMSIWQAHSWKLDYRWDRIQEEFGSFSDFVDDMRSLLRVDGQEPFLVADTGYFGYQGYPGPRQRELAEQFDATMTWVAGSAWKQNDPGNFATQETALEYVKQNFQGNREFVEEHGMEFVPMTFPGFNERGCPGERPEGRKTPRSPEFFRKTLELAEEYRTTELVNIAPYNNWLEGTPIEPGTFKGNDYGTEYLEVVKEFQNGGAG